MWANGGVMDRTYINREVRKCIELRKFAFEGETEMFEIENGHKMPKIRRAAGSTPKPVEKAIAEYNAAYKALYGLTAPPVEYRDGFVYVQGMAGVSLSIFKGRIKQLRYRKG